MKNDINNNADFLKQLEEFGTFFEELSKEIHKFYQEDIPRFHKNSTWLDISFVDKVLIAFFAGGHVLLEGIPGLGKTELVNAMVKVLGWTDEYTGKYQEGYFGSRRIQFTPDLMPLDIIGSETISTERDLETGIMNLNRQFIKGPIFTHILLADEINRATPKTQSALLQGMAELSVTYGNKIIPLGEIKDFTGYNFPKSGDNRKEDRLFFVIATQNPIEQQGTYPLPEAQLDRFFFKLITPMPGIEKLMEILKITTIEKLPEIKPIEDAPPHEISQKIINFRKIIRKISVAEKAYRKIGFIAASTWPEPQKLPLADKIFSEYAKEAREIKDKDFQEKRPRLQQIINDFVRIGIGPRGAQTLLLALKVLAALKFQQSGKTEIDEWLVQQNFNHVLKDAWRHRLLLNYQAENEQITADFILDQIAQLMWI